MKNLFEMGAKFDGSWTLEHEASSIADKCIAKGEHRLVFMLEKRNGKPVTLLGRLYLQKDEKQKLLSLLKKKLSTGGTINNEWIEIQGDMKDKIKNILSLEGWKFK